MGTNNKQDGIDARGTLQVDKKLLSRFKGACALKGESMKKTVETFMKAYIRQCVIEASKQHGKD